MRPRAERKIDGRTRRRAVSNQTFQTQIVRRRLSRRPHNIDDVILHAVVDVNAVNYVARRDDLTRINHRVHSQIRCGGRHQIENVSLLGFLRITDVQFEHEAIQLRFGQLVSSFLLYRVLCRQNQEWIGKRICFFADRDLPFLHRLQ